MFLNDCYWSLNLGDFFPIYNIALFVSLSSNPRVSRAILEIRLLVFWTTAFSFLATLIKTLYSSKKNAKISLSAEN